MRYYFHAVAVDYDGTLAEQPQPAQTVLDAIAAVRASGRACILVTGRIMAELRSDFPDVEQHFDAIVAENGAVICRPGARPRLVGVPVSAELEAALWSRNVPLRRGEVILALDAVHAATVAEEIARAGEEYQAVHNRSALMILPPAINKGVGMRAALDDLDISFHSAIAIGDAENDHSLLSSTEIGVAVSNAVPALKAHADLVLTKANGAGVAELMRAVIEEGLGAI
jgi:hydroxymethylpyrimidine pyrophosphatase-like HAD family hydrolase